MKKIFFSALAMIAFATSGFASNKTLKIMNNVENSFSLEQNKGSLKIELDLGDLNQYTNSEIDVIIADIINGIPNYEELTCEVSLKGTISVGVASAEVSVKVSGPCSEVLKSGEKMAQQLYAKIEAELKKIL